MRTITINHSFGGNTMEETEVIARVVADTQPIPVVRPDFAALVNQAHGLPAPLLPAPRAVIDPEDQLPVYPRSGATRWTKDEIAEAMWKFVIVMLIVLAGLLVWNSDTGKTIREELSVPQINLSPEGDPVPATQSAAPRPKPQTAQTQSAAGRVALPTQSATAAPRAKDIRPALAAVEVDPTSDATVAPSEPPAVVPVPSAVEPTDVPQATPSEAGETTPKPDHETEVGTAPPGPSPSATVPTP